MQATIQAHPGVLRPGEWLTTSAAKQSMQVGDWGWRKIRKMVPVTRIGRQNYVKSDDLINAIERKSAEQNEAVI